MRLVFSTRDIPGKSFLSLCETADLYGFGGFEIHDPLAEKRLHTDSPFRPGNAAADRRKLINRHLELTGVTGPVITNDTDPEDICALVECAAVAGVPYAVLCFEGMDEDEIFYLLAPAARLAEQRRVTLCLETAGCLKNTARLPGLINRFLTDWVAACWNVRETFFGAGETPEETITHLGAYIRYAAMGDRRDGKDCLIGRGELPFKDVTDALKALDYDGPVRMLPNAETTDKDLVLTHFVRTMFSASAPAEKRMLQMNRARTGMYIWPKYDLTDMTFSQVLDAMAETFPDQLAFKYTTLDYTRTYREFREDVDRVALGLIALGVRRGSHVAIWATNVPQWFLTFWATVKIGAVLVTVNTAYKIHEAEYLLNQSDTHTLVMIRGYKDSDYKAIMEELCPELKSTEPGRPLYSQKLPFLRNIITVGFKMAGCLEWNDMLRKASQVGREEVRRMAAAVKPGDVCNMQYTSGTTGFPKGVMLTHRNIVNDGKIIGDRMDLSTADRMMIQVPMFHCFGMVLSMTSMMTHGGTL